MAGSVGHPRVRGHDQGHARHAVLDFEIAGMFIMTTFCG